MRINLKPITSFLLYFITLFSFIQPVFAYTIDPKDAEAVKASLQEKLTYLIDDISKIKDLKKQNEWIKSNLSDISDLEYTSYYVLGRNAKLLSNSDVAKFTDLYTKYLLDLNTKLFQGYSGQKIKVISVEQLSTGRYKRTQIVERFKVLIEVHDPKDNKTIELSAFVANRYEVKKNQTDVKPLYRIFNIDVDGINLITLHRREFNDIFSQVGADKFIATLESKIK